jgi:hypothetical protein
MRDTQRKWARRLLDDVAVPAPEGQQDWDAVAALCERGAARYLEGAVVLHHEEVAKKVLASR